jgi:hypothetical protein
MSVVTLGCSACGHEWASALPMRPRLFRAVGLGSPIILLGVIGGLRPNHHEMALLVVLGVLISVMSFRLITPACPACGSEFTGPRRSRGPHLVEDPPGDETRKRLRRKK